MQLYLFVFCATAGPLRDQPVRGVGYEPSLLLGPVSHEA